MQITKNHIKLMKQCIGFKYKNIFSNKFAIKKNRFNVCDGEIEELKLLNELCKIGYAKYYYPEKTQAFYYLTEKAIRFLELQYSIQISISGESYGRN